MNPEKIIYWSFGSKIFNLSPPRDIELELLEIDVADWRSRVIKCKILTLMNEGVVLERPIKNVSNEGLFA